MSSTDMFTMTETNCTAPLDAETLAIITLLNTLRPFDSSAQCRILRYVQDRMLDESVRKQKEKEPIF